MTEPKHILIAGAGIGGLTTALACAKGGNTVAVFESVDVLGEVGAGLQIAANGTKVLQALGLGDALEGFGFKPRAATMRLGRSGRVIFSNPLGDAAQRRYGAPYYHVHRADLHRILFDAALRDARIQLHLGAKVEEFEDEGAQVRVILKQGDTVSGDALIGADGIHSRVREGLFGPESPRFTGNVTWRLLVPTKDLPHGLIPPEATVWTGPRGHAVTYYVRGGELVNFVGVIEREDWQVESWLEAGDLAEMKADFAPWCATIQKLLAAAKPDACFKWALFDRDPLPYWSKGRVSLVGDACHPMLPFMAQGACMAIEDAWVLAHELSSGMNVEAALLTYEAKRKKRTARMQIAARANAKRFHQATLSGQMLNYGPLWLAGRVSPGLLNKPFDWIYGEDVTA
ncbi:MAG: FAD-dependent monooxygenase [Parvibaculum sp.]